MLSAILLVESLNFRVRGNDVVGMMIPTIVKAQCNFFNQLHKQKRPAFAGRSANQAKLGLEAPDRDQSGSDIFPDALLVEVRSFSTQRQL
jgi:hypothetical protein